MTNLPVNNPPTCIEEEMEHVLQQMLDNNENITARGLVSKLACLKAASSITRNPRRVALLNVFQERQKQFRKWQGRVSKISKEDVAQALAARESKIADLQRQVEVLTASHIALIRVVGELGGYAKWAKFFESYQSIHDALHSMGAIPPSRPNEKSE